MRKLLLCFVLLGTATLAQAQSSPPAPAGWARVQALSPRTVLHIKARSHDAVCALQSADPDNLVCLSHGNSQTFQRADIKSIRVSHRARSAVVGLAIGGGGGALVGAALGTGGGIVGKGGLAGIFALPLGVLGAVIGAATDFTRSTVYHQ